MRLSVGLDWLCTSLKKQVCTLLWANINCVAQVTSHSKTVHTSTIKLKSNFSTNQVLAIASTLTLKIKLVKLFKTLLTGGLVLLSTWSVAQEQKVSLAGLAYSGDFQSIEARFPYSVRWNKQKTQSGQSSLLSINSFLKQNPPKNFQISTAPIESLKGSDQALASALIINSETISIEEFGGLVKLFVLIKGQSVFFDFKTMTMIRSYPISFALIDALDHAPSDAEILERVARVYEGTSASPGIYKRYADSLAVASIPNTVPRFLQVSQVQLSPEMMETLPDYLKKSPVVAQTWAADLVAEAISTQLQVPLIPYAKGYAVGNVMSMKVADGSVFALKLPQPDYEIKLQLTGVKKVKYGESTSGASYIYGTYSNISIEEPLSGTKYLDTKLKNGEIKLVPASQTYVDDFPAFYDSLNGMFKKLALAVAGGDTEWIKAAASSSEIDLQLKKTRELIQLCK
jgi:hypothetical protein